MKLLPAEGRVVLAAQLNTQLSVRELARRAKVKPHVAQYALRKLLDGGILRRGVLVNLAPLGLEQWVAYLSFTGGAAGAKQRLFNWLEKDRSVGWWAELGGEFQVAVAFFVARAGEVSVFLRALRAAHGGAFQKKAISRVLSFSALPKSYLATDAKLVREAVSVGEHDDELLAIDTQDWEILGKLLHPEAGSRPALARLLGIPRTTVEYRIQKLERIGVLVREIYYVSAQKLGAQLFRILVTLRGLAEQTESRILAFAKGEPEVVSVTRSLGGWDFEFGIEVFEARRAADLLDRFSEMLGAEAAHSALMPVFAQGTSRNFLAPR